MAETTSVPDDLWTSAEHRHQFKIDKDREEVSKIWKRQGIFYVRDDYLSWSDTHGYEDLVFLTCTHDRCEFYLTITKSIFYPTMIRHV